MIFFSHGWEYLDTKHSLCEALAEITAIDDDVLLGYQGLMSVSIATRMSWASKRRTTRIEDMAYCLMGLFDVNMPMLYGEGPKAFLWLQEEIMRHSDDYSLFAWEDKSLNPEAFHGLLAPSPAAFEKSGNIVTFSDIGGEELFAQTHRGLRLFTNLKTEARDTYLASLECPMPGAQNRLAAIRVKRLNDGGTCRFARISANQLFSVESRHRGASVTILVRQTVNRVARANDEAVDLFLLFNAGPRPRDGYTAIGGQGERPSFQSHLPKTIVNGSVEGCLSYARVLRSWLQSSRWNVKTRRSL